MKAKMLLSTLALVVCLSGCGVSQADYDALLSEKEAAVADLEKANSEKDSLQKQIDDLAKKNEELEAENDEMLKKLGGYVFGSFTKNSSDASISSWATTQWGDDTISGPIDKEQTIYQVIVHTDKKPEDVMAIQEDCAKAVSSLNRLFATFDNISNDSSTFTKCEKLYVRYLTSGDGELMEMVFKKKDGAFDLLTLNLNYESVNGVYNALHEGN